jgi:hypothetical protein
MDERYKCHQGMMITTLQFYLNCDPHTGITVHIVVTVKRFKTFEIITFIFQRGKSVACDMFYLSVI